MKKFFTIIFINLCIISTSVLTLNAQDEQDNNYYSPKFQLLLSGDLAYTPTNSDIEDASESQGQSAANQYNAYAASLSKVGGFKVDETSNPNVTYGIDLELRFFGQNLGVGFGTGIHSTESTTKVSSPFYTDELKYELSLNTIPLVATLYYKSPLSENSFATIGAGAGYYFGMLDGEFSSNTTMIPGVSVFEPIADGTTIGYHVKADYNYMLGPISLTVGVMGRYVEFNEFKDDDATIKIDAGLTGVSAYAAVGFAIQ